MVATVTRLSEASSTVHYFEADGYYAKNDPEHRKASRWYGKGVETLGLHGPVKPKRFEEVLQGRIPNTKSRLGRMREGRHEHRPGVDVTFSAPKSVSLEALVHAAPKTGAKIIRAHDEAVKATLDFIENELLETRTWDPATGRRPRVKAHGMVAATFRHYASRNLDPQLHTHSVIANMTRNAEGEWRSADFIRLERSKLLIGAFYRSELKRRIEALGYATTQTMVGSIPGFEIAGYDRSHLKAFSTRREEALAWARERNLGTSASVMQQAVLYTRKRKEEPSRSELAAIWRNRSQELGAGRDWHVARGRSAASREATRQGQSESRIDRERWHLRRRTEEKREDPSILFTVRRAVEHLEERRTVFSADMLRALALASGSWTLPEVDAAITRLRDDGHLREVTARRTDLAFVTDRAVRAERAVCKWMRDWRGLAGALVPAARVEEHLANGTLNAGQQSAVRTILLSLDRLVGVQGHAGTGKTTMLREVVSLAGETQVIGLAPSSSAALTLERETGLSTRTLQWLLTRYRDVGDGVADAVTLEKARKALGGRILVVDEASLISMSQMHALTRIAEATGIARVALVGDRRQLRAVEAGQPFHVLQKAGMETAVMDEVLRQRDEGLKAVVLHMIAEKPELAIEELGPGVLEMAPDELGGRAAALWLDLDPALREGTKILAPTHARCREINTAVREGLQAEGSLHGRTLEIERYVNLHLTRAQKGEIGNWQPGDMAVFHHDVYGVQAKAGDACRILGTEDGKVVLDHPDGRPRKGDPSNYLRYRVDLFETEAMELQAGDRIRWTRNDKERSLLNGEEARIAAIGRRNLRLVTSDGREFVMGHDDPQLHFIDHAWSSTVHAAQGTTCDRVIAVLDADHGSLGGQASFYVELTRARDTAVLLTDDRDALVEALETSTGEELSALEAIGHQFQDTEEKTPRPVAQKPDLSEDVLREAKAWQEEEETLAALGDHVEACLEERNDLLARADNRRLARMTDYGRWHERTAATVAAWHREAGSSGEHGDGRTASQVALLDALLVFDERVDAFEDDFQRHVREAKDADEYFILRSGIEDLLERARALAAVAPRPEDVTGMMVELPALMKALADTATVSESRADEEEVREILPAAEVQVAPIVPEPDQVHGADTEPMQEKPETTAHPAPPAEPDDDRVEDRIAERIATALEERQTMLGASEGQPLRNLEVYESWRERTRTAIDEWRLHAGSDAENDDNPTGWDVRQLEWTFDFDDRAVDLVSRWERHESAAREAGTDPFESPDRSWLIPEASRLRVLALIHREPLPRPIADILARYDAHNKTQVSLEKERVAESRAHEDEAREMAPEVEAPTAAVEPEPAPSARPKPRPKARPEPAPSPEPASSVEPVKPPPTKPEPLPALPPRPAESDVANAIAARIAAAIRERQAMAAGSKDEPLRSLKEYGSWLGRTGTAITEWRRHAENRADGRERQADGDMKRLERAIAFDNSTDSLLEDWTRHQALAEKAGAGPFGHRGAADLVKRIRALQEEVPDGEKIPGTLTVILERHRLHVEAREAARREREREKQAVEARLPRPAEPKPVPEPVRQVERPPTPAPHPEPDAAIASAAADRIALSVQGYKAMQKAAAGEPLWFQSEYHLWREGAKSAIEEWRRNKGTADQDADRLTGRHVALLEGMFEFDDRAYALNKAWLMRPVASGTADADLFYHPDIEKLLSDIRGLRDLAPDAAEFPERLAGVLERENEHVRMHLRTEALLKRVIDLDGERRRLLERGDKKDRPLNRGPKRALKRWRKDAEAVSADIDELQRHPLAGHLARIEGAPALVNRVGVEIAASDTCDALPGWLLLRLHDNASDAAGQGIHPTQTREYRDIISEMHALCRRLKEGDPRLQLLRGETRAHEKHLEVRSNIESMTAQLKALVVRGGALEKDAGEEALPINQSAAYSSWHYEAKWRVDEARKVLKDRGTYAVVLEDGSDTRNVIAEVIRKIEETREQYGPPDDTERQKKAQEQSRTRSQTRGRGFSM